MLFLQKVLGLKKTVTVVTLFHFGLIFANNIHVCLVH